MNPTLIKDFAWGFLYIFIQVVLVRHLRLFESEPDLFWVFLIYLASSRERTYSIILTGVLTFFYDAFLDLWGLHLFAFTATLFLVQRFLPRIQDQKLLTFQVGSILLITSGIANFFVVMLSGFTEIYSSNVFFWNHLIGNSIYTALLGSFLYNFSSATQGN